MRESYIIKIVYIKSYSGISGNKISDKLAKQATEYGSTLHMARYNENKTIWQNYQKMEWFICDKSSLLQRNQPIW